MKGPRSATFIREEYFLAPVLELLRFAFGAFGAPLSTPLETKTALPPGRGTASGAGGGEKNGVNRRPGARKGGRRGVGVQVRGQLSSRYEPLQLTHIGLAVLRLFLFYNCGVPGSRHGVKLTPPARAPRRQSADLSLSSFARELLAHTCLLSVASYVDSLRRE